MNCDLQTCLHVLESGSINEDSFREVLNLFHGFTSHTELVSNNRVDTATVYCRILSACQNLYEIDTWESLPKEAAEQLIQSFNNIERLYHDTSEEERKGTYVRTIWFLSELKTKAAEGRTGDIDKRIIGEYAKDLLDVFQDIRFVFDIEYDGTRLFPISQVIAAVVSGRDFQEFRNGIQSNDICTLRLAVKLFKAPEDIQILDELKSKYRLKFINYLNDECLIIDTSDFLNYQWNGTIIFYNDAEHRVLIRSLKEDYFSQCGEKGHKLQTELDCDENPIGYFVEYELDASDELCDYSAVLASEAGRINFLRLIFDYDARNVFLENSIVKKPDGSLLPINPYCINDTRLVQGYLGNKKGKTFPQSQIREPLQKYRSCFLKSHIMNRVTLGLCIFLLDTNNIGVDALGLDSLTEDDWYQNQVIQNWLNNPNTTKDHITLLLNEWYKQLSYCEKISSLEKEEFHAIDFLPLRYDLNSIYHKIYPDFIPDERLFSGIVIEDEDCPETYSIEVNDKTVAGANEKKLHHWPITIRVGDDFTVEDETLKWDQRVRGDVYFFYSLSEGHGRVVNRELLKALAGVELVQQYCLRFEVGAAVTGIHYNTIRTMTRLFETTYSEVANKTKACLATDLDIQTYLRLLHNMIWSGIDSVDRLKDYISIFRAHQIADFSEIDRDPLFQREDLNTLYVPKDSYHQSSVLSFVYDRRLKSATQRDNRHLYTPELSLIDGQYVVFGSPIESVVFLTDNFASGLSTIAALAAQLGIESDEECGLWPDRVKKANITRHRYYCGDDEVSIADIIRTNKAKILVHSYYGTSDASKRIDEFLERHEIPYEKSSFQFPLTSKAEQDMIEYAKSIWRRRDLDFKEGYYLYVREYNMPRKSIFPTQMLEEPRRFINLFNRRKELNELKV